MQTPLNIQDLPKEFSQKVLEEAPENPNFPKVSIILTTYNREYFIFYFLP